MFLLLFLTIDYLVPAVIAQVFNPTAELVTTIGMSPKEAKAAIKIHSVIVEAQRRKR